MYSCTGYIIFSMCCCQTEKSERASEQVCSLGALLLLLLEARKALRGLDALMHADADDVPC